MAFVDSIIAAIKVLMEHFDDRPFQQPSTEKEQRYRLVDVFLDKESTVVRFVMKKSRLTLDVFAVRFLWMAALKQKRIERIKKTIWTLVLIVSC